MLETLHKEDGQDGQDGLTVHNNSTQIAATDGTSPGVRRMEVLANHFTSIDRCLVLFGIFLLAYSYSLGLTLSSVYEVFAGRLWTITFLLS